MFGYLVDIARHVEWRAPVRWRVLVPYVALYLLDQMCYWWAVGLISRPLWFAYASLFVISTTLNFTSHSRGWAASA